MGVTDPLKLFVCNIRKYFRMQYWKVLSYAILERTFFGHLAILERTFLLPSVSHLRAVLISVSHLRVVLISIGTLGRFQGCGTACDT